MNIKKYITLGKTDTSRDELILLREKYYLLQQQYDKLQFKYHSVLEKEKENKLLYDELSQKIYNENEILKTKEYNNLKLQVTNTILDLEKRYKIKNQKLNLMFEEAQEELKLSQFKLEKIKNRVTFYLTRVLELSDNLEQLLKKP